MRRVLVSGSRNWSDIKTLYDALTAEWLEFGDFTLIHGGAKGADKMAHEWAKWSVMIEGFNPSIEVHPADWNTHGKAAGPIRNQKMVDKGADILLAFVREDSRGTLDCIRRARAADIRVKVFHENPENANWMVNTRRKN